jgi:hypothetical protein
MSDRKILDGGGVQLVYARDGKDAQEFMDRGEPIPSGDFCLSEPLRLDVTKVPSGHRWASEGTRLFYVGDGPAVVVVNSGSTNG